MEASSLSRWSDSMDIFKTIISCLLSAFPGGAVQSAPAVSPIPEVLHPDVAASLIYADEHLLCVLHGVFVPLATPPPKLSKALDGPQNWALHHATSKWCW